MATKGEKSRLESVKNSASKPVEAPDLRPDQGRDDPDPKAAIMDAPLLPKDCPVKALGHNRLTNYFLDDSGQFVECNSQFQKGTIYQLFAKDPDRARRYWPIEGKFKDPKTGEEIKFIKNLDQDLAQRHLIRACGIAGIFDPQGKVRGRGAHIGKRGELMLHSGDKILLGGAINLHGRKSPLKYVATGLIDGFVYPAGAKLPKAAEEAATDMISQDLLDLFRRWNWKNPEVMPVLLLGFIGCAMVCGALPWRPHIWINASSGSGKSTLMSIIEYLLDEWLLKVEDATAAGISSVLGHDTLALLLDEFEAGENNDQQQKVLELARISSSGGKKARGSSDHKAHTFTAKSCFLFSSILHSPLITQDRNRITILDALKLSPGAKAPVINPDSFREKGALIRRRLVEHWHRFTETYDKYALEILAEGIEARHANQFGTLLSVADLMLYQTSPDQMDLNESEYRVKTLVGYCLPMIHQAQVDGESDESRCVKMMASHRLPGASGHEPESIGRWLTAAIQSDDPTSMSPQKAADKLRTYGLRVVNAVPPNPRAKYPRWGIERGLDPHKYLWLAVASSKDHQGLKEIFGKSDWKGGTWTQSLSRIEQSYKSSKQPDYPDTKALPRVMVAFDGKAESSTLIPLDAVIDCKQWKPPPQLVDAKS